MSKILKVTAEEINDSRGNPTLKITVWAEGGHASFSVPSGASTGAHEAHELRDSDGKGVKNAVLKVINSISPALEGKDVLNQKDIDKTLIRLDGTNNKDNLGGNSMIGVSVACAKVAAKISKQEVYEYLQVLSEIKPSRLAPYLYMNLINGGKHVKGDQTLAFQEYHIVPDTDNIEEAVNMGKKITETLKDILIKELGEEGVVMGDEGGFAPKLTDVRQPLVYLTEAIKQNGLDGKVRLALDVASSSFYENPARNASSTAPAGGGMYKVNGQHISKDELYDLYVSLNKEFNLISIEDPFEEEDFESFAKLRKDNQAIVVGDDLTVTNVALVEKAISQNSISGMIIKPNQIGTLWETLSTMKLARENNIELIVSHRSGETDDDFIADLAFAFNCFGIKAGAPTKPERMIKYTRLIKITNLLLNTQGSPV